MEQDPEKEETSKEYRDKGLMNIHLVIVLLSALAIVGIIVMRWIDKQG